MKRETQDKLIESWGQMGALWGINTSTARVHALLMASNEKQSLDDIAGRLQISRGNASMCLKELRSWGVVKLIKMPGDRRDYYVSEPDVWKMLFAIIRERKRRELDPMVGAVREAVAEIQGDETDADKRVKQLAELLETTSQLSERILSDDANAKFLLSFLSSSSKLGR